MLGIIVSVNTAGYAAGSLFMNACFDMMGTYKAGLLVCAVIMLFIICASQLAIGMSNRQNRAIIAAESDPQAE